MTLHSHADATKSSIDRVLILGCPGSGKTKFATQLSKLTRLPLYHLDDSYWGPRWTRPTGDQWRSTQEAILKQKRWLIDGNYMATVPLRVAYAQLIVILDTPTLTCLVRTIARAWRIRSGEHSHLPLQVRANCQPGTCPKPTKDFLSLLWKILRFRYVALPRLVGMAGQNQRASKLLLIVMGPLRSHAWVNRRAARKYPDWSILSVSEATQVACERIAGGHRTAWENEAAGSNSENEQ